MKKATYLDLLAEYDINGAHPGGFALTRKILSSETLTPDMVLLDAGCGTGQTSAFIAKNYHCKIVAVDINSAMLDKARQKFARYHLDIPVYRANVENLPFRKNSFDMVLSESLITFTNIRKTLREYYRVLKPGGILLAIEVTAFMPLRRDELADIQSVVGVTNIPTMEEWLCLFENAGFSNVRVPYRQKNNWNTSFYPQVNQVFHEYFRVMHRYRYKLGFGVYHCRL